MQVGARRGAHMIGRGRRTQPDPPSSKVEEGVAELEEWKAAVVAASAASSAAAVAAVAAAEEAPGGRYKEHYVQRRKAKWERDIRRCSDEWRKRWRKCRGGYSGRAWDAGRPAANQPNYSIGNM